MTAALVTSLPSPRDPTYQRPELFAEPIAESQHNTVLDVDLPRARTTFDRGPRPIPVPGIARNIQVKIAAERSEWEEAYLLVTENYRSRGYEPANARGIRFTPFHALPDTTTFVAKHEGKVVATLSLVMDNMLLGLPMESIYGPEVAELRKANRRLVEVTSLADKGLSIREFVPVFVSLMRLMTHYSVSQNADALVITVNPRHANFYKRVMGFVPLGGYRAYPMVQDHPAEAFYLDVSLLRKNSPQMYEQIFGEPLPPEALQAPRMPAGLVRYLGSQSSHTSLNEVNDILNFVKHYGSPRRWL